MKQAPSTALRRAKVFAMVGQGLSDKDIAYRLGVKATMVRNDVFQLSRQHRCTNRTTLALLHHGIDVRMFASLSFKEAV